MFVHLHGHSSYSVLDGLAKIDDLITKAKASNMDAFAITDHASLSCLDEFYTKATNAGIKPIFGVEFYVVDDKISPDKHTKRYHLLVLAKNWDGIVSINKILTMANKYYYKRPLIDWNDALQFENCVISTACSSGVLSHPNYEQLVVDFHKIYKDDFYLELMPFGIYYAEEDDGSESTDRQKIVNEKALALSQKYGIKYIITNDFHFVEQEDSYTHEVLLAIQRHTTMDDPKRWKFDCDDVYFKTESEMLEACLSLGYLDEDIIITGFSNTREVADKCNVEVPKFDFDLPKLYDNSKQVFLEKILDGWERLVEDKNEIYAQRLQYEIDVIEKLGFIDYFLIVEDIVNYAKNNNILVGLARGSVAGSLVAYLLGITAVDPIKFGLYFERFLNPDRVSMPDIDLDFEDEKRHLVFEYITQKYGEDKTAKITTFTIMQGKNTFRDVCRVFGISPIEINTLSKLIDDDVSLEEAIDNNYVLSQFVKQNPHILKHTLKLQGVIRAVGVHAAGIVISNRPLVEKCVVEYRKGGNDNNVFVTSFDKDTCEKYGLLKIDVLGLSSLSIVSRAIDLIKNRHNIHIDIYDIVDKLDDQATFDNFKIGNTTGVFQFESSGMKNLLRDINGDTFEKLYHATALFRPGSLDSGETQRYIDIVNRRKAPNYYGSKELESILGETFSILVFQEQMMAMFHRISNFTLSHADTMRKIVGKKLGEDAFKQYEEQFIEGVKEKGIISEDIGRQLFKQMVAFANYSFNKCIAGSCYINREQNGRKQYTIEEMYKAMNDLKWCRQNNKMSIRSKYLMNGYGKGISDIDGILKYNNIVDIRFEGYKDVYLIKTETGKEIRVTSNHKIPTQDGIKTIDDGLQVGDVIFTKGERVKNNYKYNITEYTQRERAYNAHSYSDKITDNNKPVNYRGGFIKGENNPMFINGEYSKFVQNRQLLQNKAKGICSKCMQKSDRLECHHIDFNRSNNDIDNLVILCPSCHKKAHYVNGRKRKGDNGWHKIEEKIVAIQYAGKENVYDVEMEAPNHTVVVNDILVCNSHAVGYTLLSFLMMYLKVHYPLEYYTALLASDREDKVKHYIRDAKANNVIVDLPDINYSNNTFDIHGDRIIAPLTSIKGVGQRASDCIIKERIANGYYKTYDDFLNRVYKRVVNKRVQKLLFEAGALRSVGLQEEDETQREYNYINLLSIYDNIPTIFLVKKKLEKDILLNKYKEVVLENDEVLILPKTSTKPSILVLYTPSATEGSIIKDGAMNIMWHKSTSWMLDIPKPYGITLSNFYITSTTKKAKRTKSKYDLSKFVFEPVSDSQTLEQFMPFLEFEIELVNPDIIICLSNFHIPMFLDKKQKAQDLVGTVEWSKKFNKPVAFCYSPQYCYYQNKMDLIQQMFQNINDLF